MWGALKIYTCLGFTPRNSDLIGLGWDLKISPGNYNAQLGLRITALIKGDSENYFSLPTLFPEVFPFTWNTFSLFFPSTSSSEQLLLLNSSHPVRPLSNALKLFLPPSPLVEWHHSFKLFTKCACAPIIASISPIKTSYQKLVLLILCTEVLIKN